MIIKTLARINLIAATTVNAIFAYEVIKVRMRKLAETETAHTPTQYVLIRLARGHYYTPDGFEMIVNDYKFFQIIQNNR
jgi:hypothetical protein